MSIVNTNEAGEPIQEVSPQEMYGAMDPCFVRATGGEFIQKVNEGSIYNSIADVSVDACYNVCKASCECPGGNIGAFGLCADTSVIGYTAGFYGGLAWT